MAFCPDEASLIHRTSTRLRTRHASLELCEGNGGKALSASSTGSGSVSRKSRTNTSTTCPSSRISSATHSPRIMWRTRKSARSAKPRRR